MHERISGRRTNGTAKKLLRRSVTICTLELCCSGDQVKRDEIRTVSTMRGRGEECVQS
jgi:hypothetical protein